MGIDKEQGISNEFADTELGGEFSIPTKYHAAAEEQQVAQGVPLHPPLEPSENEEEVLGI
ncbi:MAG: hypothetical protein COB36_03910 [Alphaproteobacteria bacterium]|nr:MAG: hypothetical protein COB36_03910 [Alphaproteobacteria bacterium]